MRLKWLIVCWLCICAAVPKAAAQSNAIWMLDRFLLDFNFNNTELSGKNTEDLSLPYFIHCASTKSSADGTLQLMGYNNRIYDNKGSLIFDMSNQIYKGIKMNNNTHHAMDNYLQIGHQKYIYLNTTNFSHLRVDTMSWQLRHFVIDKNENYFADSTIENPVVIKDEYLWKQPLNPRFLSMQFSPVRRDSNEYFVFICLNGYLYAINFKNTSFSIVDSISLKETMFAPYFQVNEVLGNSEFIYIYANIDGSKIILYRGSRGFSAINPIPISLREEDVYTSSLNIIDFDPINKTFKKD